MPEEKKYYLTKERLLKLKAEYRHLKKMRTLKAREESPKVLHSEDLNPEYLSFKEDLDFIETRLLELNNTLKNYRIIKLPPKEKRKIVNLGAIVAVEVDGQRDEFQIVGSLEANPGAGKISNESPVGQALLGHKAGEDVVISSPINVTYKIKKVKYRLS